MATWRLRIIKRISSRTDHRVRECNKHRPILHWWPYALRVSFAATTFSTRRSPTLWAKTGRVCATTSFRWTAWRVWLGNPANTLGAGKAHAPLFGIVQLVDLPLRNGRTGSRAFVGMPKRFRAALIQAIDSSILLLEPQQWKPVSCSHSRTDS